MANVIVDKNKIDLLANAISAKSGEPLTLTLDEMVEAVDGIETGGITPIGNIDITRAGVTDVTNYATATVPQGEMYVSSVEGFKTVSGARKWYYQPIASIESSDAYGTEGFIADHTIEYGAEITYNAIAKNTTVTPTTSSQTIGGADYMMEGAVTVSAMPSGTAGTPTATKGSVSNHSVTVTPSVTNTTGYITGSTINGTAVTVTASELASGNKEITSNGTDIDVVGYSTVSVAVPTTGAVWQDQNGYVHLSDEGGGPTPPTPTPTPTPWERPSDWPDLSKMDVSGGDILYMTSYADEARGFCNFYVNCTGNYTVEVGYISGSTFTAESTYTYQSGSTNPCTLYYGSVNGTYKVLRVTGTAITNIYFHSDSIIEIGSFKGWNSNQGIIDVVGKLPSGTNLRFAYQRNIVNIEVSGLTLSGNKSNMFYNCSSLSALDVSSWDVGSVTSMSGMFSSCYSLSTLDVSSWDVGSVTNMSNMFSSCYSLSALDVSSWDVGSVTSMSGMFSSCYSLSTLDVSEWDVGSVTNMSSMLSSCHSLSTLDVSEWDVGSVTNMTQIFYNCYSLSTLDVSEWDVGSVTNMSSMFLSCYSLSTLDVSEWDVGSVTNMSGMFYNCSSLSILDVSKWDVGSVTDMSNMFQGCYSLGAVDVSEWDVGSVTNMSQMFYSCYSLSAVDLSSWDVSSVNKASNTNSMFRYCRGIYGSLTLPSTMAYIGSYCFDNMRSIYEWHFEATTPPTLADTNAFSNMTDFGGKKIYVPYSADHSVLNAYKIATNWSAYASYIVEESA